jgi:hypothetical protein
MGILDLVAWHGYTFQNNVTCAECEAGKIVDRMSLLICKQTSMPKVPTVGNQILVEATLLLGGTFF